MSTKECSVAKVEAFGGFNSGGPIARAIGVKGRCDSREIAAVLTSVELAMRVTGELVSPN